MKKLLSVITSCAIVFALILGSSCLTIDIVSRDDPASPSYDPSSTPADRLSAAVRRSFARAKRFRAMVDEATNGSLARHAPIGKSTRVIVDDGQYLMNVSIGTPPVQIIATMETGGDLLWTQCKPCMLCYPQRAPLFDPKSSSTYRPIACDTRACDAFPKSICNGDRGTCGYSITYGDDSISAGDLAVDTVTLGAFAARPVSLSRMVIGCGDLDDGSSFIRGSSGVVGLGGGQYSLIGQMKRQIGGRFSYCLIPQTHVGAASRMSFGNDAAVVGAGAVSTPMVRKSPANFYFLTLKGFTVGKRYVRFDKGLSGESTGNIVIDPGAALTYLPDGVANELVAAVSASIKGTRVENPNPDTDMRLCYRSSPGHEVRIPPVTCHFDGADVVLQRGNTFVAVERDVICFAFAANPLLSVFGNVAQSNFQVGYDLIRRRVTFKPADCLKVR